MALVFLGVSGGELQHGLALWLDVTERLSPHSCARSLSNCSDSWSGECAAVVTSCDCMTLAYTLRGLVVGVELSLFELEGIFAPEDLAGFVVGPLGVAAGLLFDGAGLL